MDRASSCCTFEVNIAWVRTDLVNQWVSWVQPNLFLMLFLVRIKRIILKSKNFVKSFFCSLNIVFVYNLSPILWVSEPNSTCLVYCTSNNYWVTYCISSWVLISFWHWSTSMEIFYLEVAVLCSSVGVEKLRYCNYKL